ncbi:MAG: acyl carrier protein [Gammaproteobacteria bacterium]|nr:acyl carrier protein [Gammaproteobacteria bacterium]
MTSDISSKIGSYISSELLKSPDRQVQPDEPLISGGLIDSFSLVDLALFIEETYGVQIDDTELNADTFDSLNQLASLVKTRM